MNIYIFLLIIIKTAELANQDCAFITPICNQENHCQNCIRAHHCCHWCFEADFKGYRCNVKTNSEFSKCDPSYIVNNTETKFEIKENAPFADVEENISEAIQFRPRELSIDLRIGEPINITIQYQPARNFPLDLYYLMDLTKSMQSDLDTLRFLGFNLTTLLSDITRNYQIAFGSYIDKPTVPFYNTDDSNYENPCYIAGETCEMGYLFKHRLNFTKDVDRFIEEVDKSDVSANLDNLEGGMDALMQILLCGQELGWSENSRKLIIVATEGIMHFAGDGLLSGSVRRNRDTCLVTSREDYMKNSLLYDYPSLEEIHHELKRKKTNIIVAAKFNSVDYYKRMSTLMEEATFVGELKQNSANILELVREGYYTFIKQVDLFINTTTVDGLEVDFFADCDGDGIWKKGSMCSNAQEGKTLNFTVQFLLKKPQIVDSSILNIEESKINDKIKINLNFIGSKCDCPNMSETTECIHGTFDCGNCTCDYGWTGDDCSELCDNNINNCRFEDDGILSLTCSSNGDCICSKCDCYFPYTGEFCQYYCPVDSSSNLICGGHGTCIEGNCTCNEMYTGPECTCLNSTEGCAIPGVGILCNLNGNCECNRCNCREGYSGHYCEICDQCRGLCKNFEEFVVAEVKKEPRKDTETVKVEVVKDLEENENCVYRYENNDEKCEVLYMYFINNDKSVDIKMLEPYCTKPIAASVAIAIIIGSIIAIGVLAILIWKARNMYRDKIEYQQFMKNKENTYHSEQNPLYMSPVVRYENPMELVNMESTSRG